MRRLVTKGVSSLSRNRLFSVSSQEMELTANFIKQYATRMCNRSEIDALKGFWRPTDIELAAWNPLRGEPKEEHWRTLAPYIFPAEFAQRICAVSEMARQVNALMNDPMKCVKLLAPLDNELRKTNDLSKMHTCPGEGIWLPGRLCAPSSPWQKIEPSFDDRLVQIIKEKLRKYDIATQTNTPPYCSGFLEEERANALIAEGEIFCELPYKGSLILHGLYVHYIQWYIIASACEQGIVHLPQGLSLKEFLTATVRVKNFEDTPLWAGLFDYGSMLSRSVPLSAVTTSFGRPHHLTSRLFFCSDLPGLQSWLLTYAWHHPIVEIQSMMDRPAPYDYLIMRMGIDPTNVGNAQLGISNAQIKEKLASNGSGLTLFDGFARSTGTAKKAAPDVDPYARYNGPCW